MDHHTKSPVSLPFSDDEVVSENADADSVTDGSSVDEEESNTIILEPDNSERQYWRDIRTKTEREIWRPGDGDGDRATDYYDKLDPPRDIKGRWKFYQLSLGPIKYEHNEPPKYVFLDDRACHEILKSNIPRASLGKFWPHDFGLSGKIRDRRPHRGRGSVGDPDAEGNDQFDFTSVGIKNVKYYFTGEKDYIPIIYRSEELSAEIEKKLEKKRKGWNVRNRRGDPKARGHNQFTPRDWLVKNGAPSNAKSKKKKKKTPADHKVPEWLLDKPKQVNPSAVVQAIDGTVKSPFTRVENGQYGISEPHSKKRKVEGDAQPAYEEQSSSPNQVFPFHQQSVGHQPVPSGLYNPLAPIGNGYHQESTCPYTQSRTYASQLEKDLATARDTISEQKGKIAELEGAEAQKQGLIEELRRELQDLRWSIGR